MSEVDPAPALPIVDDTEDERFEVVQEGAAAQLWYELEGDRLILIHTEVPKQFAGRGVGGQLVRAAIDRARRDGLAIAPWCPFARNWLRDHAEAATDVIIDWSEPPAT
jgi:predicted GNAT family acetyltransferase